MGYGSDIIVIGRKSDTIKFTDAPNHHALDVPTEEWSISLNNTWASVAIARRAPIRLTSDIADNMWDFVKNRPTVFAQEYQQLMNAGYKHVGNYLLPPTK